MAHHFWRFAWFAWVFPFKSLYSHSTHSKMGFLPIQLTLKMVTCTHTRGEIFLCLVDGFCWSFLLEFLAKKCPKIGKNQWFCQTFWAIFPFNLTVKLKKVISTKFFLLMRGLAKKAVIQTYGKNPLLLGPSVPKIDPFSG